MIIALPLRTVTEILTKGHFAKVWKYSAEIIKKVFWTGQLKIRTATVSSEAQYAYKNQFTCLWISLDLRSEYFHEMNFSEQNGVK